jgi:lipopolysaccharide export system permease protein
MMNRLTRYVLADFLAVFCFTVAVMSAFMILGVVALQAIREGLSPACVLRLLPYSVPIAFLYAVPGATLFAVCSIYGRMSAANEIVAIKSAGISPMTVVWPIFWVTLALSCGVVWLNDVAVSWGNTGVKRVVLESVEQIAYGMLRTHKSYTTKRFSINVRAVVGHRLINPTVTLRLTDDGPPMICVAEEAELHSNPAEDTLEIVLRDCEIDWGDYHGDFPDEVKRQIPLSAATRRGYDSNRPADTALAKIPSEIRAQTELLTQRHRALAAQAAAQMLAGEFDALSGPEWAAFHSEIASYSARLHKLRTEPWRRVANGFSCLCFALVGAPLAIWRRNSDFLTTFFICFFPILLAYYPALMYGVELAKSGDMPPHCVFLGNAILAIVGYWLIRKMLRY